MYTLLPNLTESPLELSHRSGEDILRNGAAPKNNRWDDAAPIADITQLAAQICRTPIAFVLLTDTLETGSSVDEPSKSRYFPCLLGWNDADMLARAAFCDHALDQHDFFLVGDAWKDGRFAHDRLVTDEPYFRFFAGAPLIHPSGLTYGALCVLDTRPRLLGDLEAFALRTLATQLSTTHDLWERIDDLTGAVSKEAETGKEAVILAQHDNLTGLPNRALFLERVTNALRAASDERGTTGRKAAKRKMGVLFLDLDKFKRINDTLGHAVGDLLLMEVAARFNGCLRPDETLARLGGDEFTILLPDIPDANYAEGVAQMLLRSLRRPVMINGEELHIGASIGISICPSDGEDASTLMRHADVAMYEAKMTGGYQSFKRSMNSNGYQHLTEEAELRRAIENDELSLCYQPQYDLKSGSIVGLEALARWRHPERGLIPPSHFIALAEQADLMAMLGEWVLHRACTDASTWIADGHPDLHLAVNFSSRQLAHPELAGKIMEILHETNLPGNRLVLELTETALCAKGDDTPKTLRELRELGVRLFVDDFGTGFSSLALLRRFPVDALKVDRLFVAGLGKEAADEALVRALIEMAHALKLTAIAEGVETDLQHRLLEGLGCDLVQGFLYSRPIPLGDLRTLLKSAA